MLHSTAVSLADQDAAWPDASSPATWPDPTALISHPVLDGIPVEYEVFSNDVTGIRLAATLLELDIAKAEDWITAGRNPTEFSRIAISRLLEQNGSAEVEERFTRHVSITDHLGDGDDDDKKEPFRLFLTGECGNCASTVVIGPSLDHLVSLDRRLAVLFYRTITESLNRWVHVYDHAGAREWIRMYWDAYEPNEPNVSPDLNPGGSADPEDHEAAEDNPTALLEQQIPDYLKDKSVSWEEARTILDRLRDPLADRLFEQLSRLRDTSEKNPKLTVPREIAEEGEWEIPFPTVLLIFERHDQVEASFEEEWQYRFQGEYLCMPDTIIPFDPRNSEQVASACRGITTLTQVLTEFNRLIALMPGNDGSTDP